MPVGSSGFKVQSLIWKNWKPQMDADERRLGNGKFPLCFYLCSSASICGFIFPMREQSLEFLKMLVNTPSPSGHETRGQRAWLDYVKSYADETFSDAYGNCVAVLNKGGSPRIMLAAHADEIAMSVNWINDDGFIYVRKVGGVDPAITKAKRVIIHSKKGPVKGVVGNVAPHLMKLEKDPKLPKIEDLFIDIGVNSRAEALKLVQIGDPITLSHEFEMLRGDLAVARAFDNRIGTWSVAEALRLLKEGKGKLNAEVCAVSNIMEEVGLFGARQIAYSLKPDVALVVDVTHATDYPTVNKAQHGDIKIGKGPTLTHGGCNHSVVVERIEEIARKQKIRLQHEAISSTSGTDTDVIFWTRGGIPSALISLPNRYMHSPVELVSLKDLEQIPILMSAFALSVKKGEAFKVKI
jgi:putative aminopeptidase FrvX